MPIKYTNGRKIFQMTGIYNSIFYSKVLQKYTQIGMFGLKRNHLATLGLTDFHGNKNVCLNLAFNFLPFFSGTTTPATRLTWASFRAK
jgi:hypothetical protein